MGKTSNEIKSKLLGESVGKAYHRLRKQLLFYLAEKLNMTICYRCNKKIESYREFSIEHTKSWQASETPKETFFNLEDISFSHLSCNCGARKNFKSKKIIKHPGITSYQNGCRCDKCKKFNRDYRRRYRNGIRVYKTKVN